LVMLVFPPSKPDGFSLIVDGEAAVDGDGAGDGDGVTVTPTWAVLHRPAV
jgi:hypothetical protein